MRNPSYTTQSTYTLILRRTPTEIAQERINLAMGTPVLCSPWSGFRPGRVGRCAGDDRCFQKAGRTFPAPELQELVAQ